MDLVVKTERSPVPGETIAGQEFAMIPGGKGANQAVAAARLGSEVSMIGCVGGDIFGIQLIEQMRKEGIDTSRILTVQEASTGVALIQVQQDGDNSIVVVAGANGCVTPAIVMQAEEAIRSADVLLVQLEIPLEAVEQAIELAHRHGVRTILNPAPASELPQPLLHQVDIVTPNETEASILAAGTVESSVTMGERIERLKILTGQGNVIVTQGDKGVLFDLDGRRGSFPAYEVVVVDTTAAGDSFNAGVAVRWAEGAELKEAIRFASAVGALTYPVLVRKPRCRIVPRWKSSS